jgi:hypothetical protein
MMLLHQQNRSLTFILIIQEHWNIPQS